MRRIIKGKLYDTETATLIGSREFGERGEFRHFCEDLYQKKTGELFLYGQGGPLSKYGVPSGEHGWDGSWAIIPACEYGEDKLKDWVAQYCSVDAYIKLFGPVTE